MWKWLVPSILSIFFFVVAIWQVFRTEKSKLGIILTIIMLLISTIISVLNYIPATPNPSERYIGFLKPRNKEASIEKLGTSLSHDDKNRYFGEIKIGKESFLLPLGPYIPFSIKKEVDGLAISAIVFDFDGKIIAEIINNKWKRYLANPCKFNFDKSAFEIINQYRIPVFQIEYVDPETVRFGGIFRTGKLKISEEFPDFPYPKEPNFFPLFLYDTGIQIMGKDWKSVPLPANDSELQKILTIARKAIPPWFDYSNPDLFGRRLPDSTPDSNQK